MRMPVLFLSHQVTNTLSSIENDSSISINSVVQYAFMTQACSLQGELTYQLLWLKAEGKTILLASHVVQDEEEFCDND